MRLARRIRKTRLDLGLSQQQLAERSRVAIGTVRALERERSVDPSFFTVVALARTLQLEAADLMQLDAADPVGPP